ncbi:BCL2 modifying factor 2 [Salminus brasiliensis]|uniref:BCL2 modifying factor 2 n=1 Tax=Salminus brasiliensis TaxID=930266 RepID=UPI003B8306E3
MEDEEEDLPVVSHYLGRPIEDRGTHNRATVNDNMPLLQTIPRCRTTGSGPDASPPCGMTGPLHRPLHSTVGLGLVSSPTGSAEETRALLHSLIFFPEDFPAMSEQNLPAARVEEQEEEVEDKDRPDRKEEEAQEGMSVEVQIGRKLREIGDQFQQDHLEMFMQYQRVQMPGWWRLASTLFNLLFPREAVGPGGAQR